MCEYAKNHTNILCEIKYFQELHLQCIQNSNRKHFLRIEVRQICNNKYFVFMLIDAKKQTILNLLVCWFHMYFLRQFFVINVCNTVQGTKFINKRRHYDILCTEHCHRNIWAKTFVTWHCSSKQGLIWNNNNSKHQRIPEK